MNYIIFICIPNKYNGVNQGRKCKSCCLICIFLALDGANKIIVYLEWNIITIIRTLSKLHCVLWNIIGISINRLTYCKRFCNRRISSKYINYLFNKEQNFAIFETRYSDPKTYYLLYVIYSLLIWLLHKMHPFHKITILIFPAGIMKSGLWIFKLMFISLHYTTRIR